MKTNITKLARRLLIFYRFRGRQGIAIYLAMVILSITLAVGLGVNLLVTSRLKIINQAIDSMAASNAAEEGTEWALYQYFNGYIDESNYLANCNVNGISGLCASVAGGGASYEVTAFMCPNGVDFCFDSVGECRDAQRIIRSNFDL